MKKTAILMIALAALSACTQTQTPAPAQGGQQTPGATVTMGHWLPNWQTDTLVGVGIDSFDVIYTLKKGDTSMINYKGVDYYIWAQCPYTDPTNFSDWFENNDNVYNWIYISTHPFDTSNIIAGNAFCSAMPPKYYNKDYDTWHTQDFVLMINPQKPPFPEWVNMGIYSSFYKYLLR